MNCGKMYDKVIRGMHRYSIILGNTSTDYGVVISSDHKERTVMVKWVKPYTPGQSSK